MSETRSVLASQIQLKNIDINIGKETELVQSRIIGHVVDGSNIRPSRVYQLLLEDLYGITYPGFNAFTLPKSKAAFINS